MEQVGIGCTALVAVVFGFAAAGKLRGAPAWAAFVATTGTMLPTRRPPAALVAGVVAGAEVATTLLAVVALTTRAAVAPVALGLAAALLVAFLAGIAGVLRSGRTVRCRCFGATGAAFGRNHLVRNGILLLIVACGLTVGRHAPLDGAALVAAAAGAVGGLSFVYWDELAYLVSDPAQT